MLFLTAACLGIVSGLTRSAFSIAIVAALIVMAFALASGISAGPVHYAKLLVGIAGFNGGLLVFIGAFAVIGRRNAESRSS